MGLGISLVLFSISILCSCAFSDLIISKLDRRIDLTSHIVRATSTIKVENTGSSVVSDVLFPIPDHQAKNLAYLSVSYNEGKGKTKGPSVSLAVEVVHPKGMLANLTTYSVSLLKGLAKGESLTLDMSAVFTNLLQPFPDEITQAEFQFVVFQDSAVSLSPYPVRVQSLTIKFPSSRVESYSKLPNTKLVESEIKYGPYENIPPFSYNPIAVHFENNRPFAVAQELVRELEISHWGNVQVIEHYNLVHGGARNKGGFSRIEYQARPHIRGASSFRHLTARLPPRAHSVFYRDEIGNISTSNLWGDSKKTELSIEPRFPMFGGWRTTFTIGYGLPLQEYLFESEGKRLLNISFGSPIDELAIDNLFVKVVLPEGSKDISVSVPFATKQWEEIKCSHLDIIGRPVVVLEKKNVVPEHNVHFQVYYKFNSFALLQEPMMLVFGFFCLFVACILYMHSDMSISKSSPSYLAKLQWEEVQATVQQVRNIINRCLVVHDKLEASLRDLSRTGDVQACKAVRKAGDALLKESAKELKPLLGFLQSSPQAAQIWPKVDELVAKEKEAQDKLMSKHLTVVECYEKKTGARDIDNRIASHQQRLTALRLEVDDLLEVIDEI